MPYIKKYLRTKFDPAVVNVNMARFDDSVQVILDGVKGMKLEDVDGCLNYAFTQLLRKSMDLVDAKIVIGLVINTLFWGKPKYIRFERVHGLLHCMIEEYKRRGWCRQKKVIKILKYLLRRNSRYRDDYEDKKIRENGDI